MKGKRFTEQQIIPISHETTVRAISVRMCQINRPTSLMLTGQDHCRSISSIAENDSL